MQFMNIITPVFVHVSISFVEFAFVKKSIVTILDKNLTCQNIFNFYLKHEWLAVIQSQWMSNNCVFL